ILCPAFSASVRHRSSSLKSSFSSGSSFFNGWRSTPGMIPATSQLSLLSSITQINVWLGSNGVSERLRSLSGFCCCFGLCIDWLHWRVDRGADGAISRLIIRRSMRCHRRSPHSIYFPMLTFILRRLLQTIPTILAVVALIFMLFSIIPGSFVSGLGDDGRGLDTEVYERMPRELGLDDPVHVRFGRYVGGLVRGDFGTSFKTKEPVTTMISKRMVPTLLLVFAAMLIAMSVGIPLGFVAALKPGSLID